MFMFSSCFPKIVLLWERKHSSTFVRNNYGSESGYLATNFHQMESFALLFHYSLFLAYFNLFIQLSSCRTYWFYWKCWDAIYKWHFIVRMNEFNANFVSENLKFIKLKSNKIFSMSWFQQFSFNEPEMNAVMIHGINWYFTSIEAYNSKK